MGQTVQDWIVDREWRGGKDWTITPGFPVPGGGDVGFVRLNLQGRERDGFLREGDDASDYVDFLSKQLKALRVKQTNEPLIDDIVLSRDAFPGSHNYLLPDVFLTWRPDAPATEICSPELGTIKATLKTGRGGTHTGDSFAIISGVGLGELPPLSHVAITNPTCNGSSLRRDAQIGASRSAAVAAAVRQTKLLPPRVRLSNRRARREATGRAHCSAPRRRG